MTAPILRTRIKICGLTRPEDVDRCVAEGVDAIGLNLYPASPRFVGLDGAVALAQRLPPFVTPVLLFVNASPADVARARAALPHAVLQFHGDETPDECTSLAGGSAYIRAARIPLEPASSFDLLRFVQDFRSAQALLLDAHVPGYGGGGKTFPWSLLPLSVNSHLVLSGGLTPANVTDGIAQVRPRCKTLAVDVSSGVESAKGIKDPEKIHQFVRAVRDADEQLAFSFHAGISTP